MPTACTKHRSVRWDRTWFGRHRGLAKAIVAGVVGSGIVGSGIVGSGCSAIDVPSATPIATSSPTEDGTPRTDASEPGRTGAVSTGHLASNSTATTRPEATRTTVPPFDAPLPTAADEMAAALITAERTIRDPSVDTETARTAGRRAQRLYASWTDHPDWTDRVLSALPDDVRTEVELHWSARRNLSALVTSTRLATEMPQWRIREPLGIDELRGYYHEAQEATGVPWTVLASIHLIETRGTVTRRHR